MVIETAEGNPQQESGKTNLPCVDNIMSGISNTGRVKMNNHKKKLRQKFDIIRKLGQGTYGKVQLGINKGTGQEVAIKTIKKCKIETEADLVRIRREVQIMSSVQHPNIIHIYEVFENREKMVLVMEFASGGELYDYLSERKVLEEDEARRIFRQIAIAVYYCHKHRICHRDLKLENILLDDQGNAKIADFGLSNIYDGSNLLATFCGSPLYASPEIVKGTPYQGPEVDCWSLGVLLYTLVYGAMPFDGSNFKRLVKQISAGEYYEPKKPSPASGLIREMLTVCPKRRATIEQICNNSWVNEGYQEPCLALAEELANQTPVRLDVLLALSAPAPNADQLVVNSESGQNDSGVARSQSLGSMRDMITDEAEKRILDMVQQQEAEDEHRVAGIVLQESPTRVISSCVPEEDVAGHPKRKLDSAISTENANLIQTKREKAGMSNASIQLIQTKEDESLSKIQETPREDRNFDSLDLETLESTNDISESPTVAEDAEIVKDTKSLSQQTTKSATSATVVPSPKENRILTRKKSMPEKSSVPHYSQISRGRELEQSANIAVIAARLEKIQPQPTATIETQPTVPKPEILSKDVSESSIKSTTSDFSLDEARRSMENSIALLNKAKNESMEYQPTAEPVNELDELGSLDPIDRQRKLKNAREVIGNAINPRFGIRKPQLAFGKNGRSISGSVVPMSSSEFGKTNLKAQQVTPEPEEDQLGTLPQSNVKTSHAEIHLKSATLPRRKTAKTEIKLQIKNPETPMFFQTEMAHRMPDFRNNAVPVPQMSSSSRSSMDRRSSLESPQTKSTASVSTYRSGSVSKSTQPGTPSTPSTINDNYQPIKKSPREFIIPIAIESGEIITPRASSLEPSKASSIASSSSTFSRFGAPSSQFSHDSDLTEPHHFALHRLRSSRPINKFAESNDSGSSGDEDDEDGFEILTAGDLFSTLLSRVQAFTQRMNIGNDSNFPKSRLFKNNMRQTTDNPFWFSDSFGRKPHSYSIKTEITHEYRRDVRTVPWRHSMSRDLFSNADALLASARASAVAKLPRVGFRVSLSHAQNPSSPQQEGNDLSTNRRTEILRGNNKVLDRSISMPTDMLDIHDLDLSNLRLSKKESETLSGIIPKLPKECQDQLLSQIPANQARKISRNIQQLSRENSINRNNSSSRDTNRDRDSHCYDSISNSTKIGSNTTDFSYGDRTSSHTNLNSSVRSDSSTENIPNELLYDVPRTNSYCKRNAFDYSTNSLASLNYGSKCDRCVPSVDLRLYGTLDRRHSKHLHPCMLSTTQNLLLRNRSQTASPIDFTRSYSRAFETTPISTILSDRPSTHTATHYRPSSYYNNSLSSRDVKYPTYNTTSIRDSRNIPLPVDRRFSNLSLGDHSLDNGRHSSNTYKRSSLLEMSRRFSIDRASNSSGDKLGDPSHYSSRYSSRESSVTRELGDFKYSGNTSRQGSYNNLLVAKQSRESSLNKLLDGTLRFQSSTMKTIPCQKSDEISGLCKFKSLNISKGVNTESTTSMNHRLIDDSKPVNENSATSLANKLEKNAATLNGYANDSKLSNSDLKSKLTRPMSYPTKTLDDIRNILPKKLNNTVKSSESANINDESTKRKISPPKLYVNEFVAKPTTDITTRKIKESSIKRSIKSPSPSNDAVCKVNGDAKSITNDKDSKLKIKTDTKSSSTEKRSLFSMIGKKILKNVRDSTKSKDKNKDKDQLNDDNNKTQTNLKKGSGEKKIFKKISSKKSEDPFVASTSVKDDNMKKFLNEKTLKSSIPTVNLNRSSHKSREASVPLTEHNNINESENLKRTMSANDMPKETEKLMKPNSQLNNIQEKGILNGNVKKSMNNNTVTRKKVDDDKMNSNALGLIKSITKVNGITTETKLEYKKPPSSTDVSDSLIQTSNGLYENKYLKDIEQNINDLSKLKISRPTDLPIKSIESQSNGIIYRMRPRKSTLSNGNSNRTSDTDGLSESPNNSEDRYSFTPLSSQVYYRTQSAHLPLSHNGEETESVIDRIKRKSYYSRFNEKKPRRQSTIVGPSAHKFNYNYDRETGVTNKSTPTTPTSPTGALNHNYRSNRDGTYEPLRSISPSFINESNSNYLRPDSSKSLRYGKYYIKPQYNYYSSMMPKEINSNNLSTSYESKPSTSSTSSSRNFGNESSIPVYGTYSLKRPNTTNGNKY